MRKMPMILAGIFIVITLVRVAALADQGFSAGALGWLFSIGLGAGVFISGYYARVNALDRDGNESTRSQQTRRIAIVSLMFFVLVDGFFNLVEVLRTLKDPSLQVAAIVYGIFPTIAAAILGIVQGAVDKLPKQPDRYSITLALKSLLSGKIRSLIAENPIPIAAEPKQIEPPKYTCQDCGFTTNDQRAYAGHRKKHRN